MEFCILVPSLYSPHNLVAKIASASQVTIQGNPATPAASWITLSKPDFVV